MAKNRARRRARLQKQTAENGRKKDKRRDDSVTFAQEYAYVLKDLRRVFALAAVMFILLIVLNVIVQ